MEKQRRKKLTESDATFATPRTDWGNEGSVPDLVFRLGRTERRLLTEPAGNPSFLGLPTGRLIFGRAGGSREDFFPLPLGRPGLRFITWFTGSETCSGSIAK
jgi:hypothetical protein